jgi:hypothetical protein
MTVEALTRRGFMHDVLAGFPADLTPDPLERQLERYCHELDTLAAIDPELDEPYIDDERLHGLIAEFTDHDVARALVDRLRALGDDAFFTGGRRMIDGRKRPVAWFELARYVKIYDGTPEATFGDLDVYPGGVRDAMAAVRRRWPSLELELLDPLVLPSRVRDLLVAPVAASDLVSVDRALAVLSRQLGWWAAATAVLLVAPATLAEQELIAWPLAMHLLAAGIGGWTMTVVGSCLLAPLD